MNNYHLCLIRASYVNQLAAYLVAGIAAIILVSSMTAAPRETRTPETPAAVRLTHTALPAPASLLAANK